MRRQLLVGVAGIVLLAAVAVGGAVADEPVTSAEREGGDILVYVPADDYETTAENATLDIDLEGEAGSIEGATLDGDRYRFEYPLASMAESLTYREPTGNLTVSTPERTEIHGVTVEYIEFGAEQSARDGQFRFDVVSLGFEDGDAIPIAASAGEETTTVTGDLRVDANGSVLVVDPVPLDGAIPLFEEAVVLRAFPDEPQLRTDSGPVDLVDASTFEVTAIEGVQITHPLIFAGRPYTVSAEMDGPDGYYGAELAGTRDRGPGELSLPPSLLASESVTITVRREGVELVSRYTLGDETLSPDVTEGTMTADGEIRLDGDLAGSVDAVWLDDGDGVRELSGYQRTDAGLDVDADYLGSADEYRLLIETSDGVVRADVAVESPLDGIDVGAAGMIAAVVLSVIGLAVGGAGHHLVRTSRAGLVVTGLLGIAPFAVLALAYLLTEIPEVRAVSLLAAALASVAVAVGVDDDLFGDLCYFLAISLALAAVWLSLDGALRFIAAIGIAAMVPAMTFGSNLGLPGLTDSRTAAAIGVAFVALSALLVAMAPITDLDVVWAVLPLFALGFLSQAAALAAMGTLSSPKPRTDPGSHRLTVEVYDGVTDRRITDDTTLMFERKDERGDPVGPITISGGRDTVELEGGTWSVMPATGDTEAVDVEVPRSREVTIERGPKAATIATVDPNGAPIEGATVVFETDAGDVRRDTGDDGRASVEVPFDTDRVDVTIEHDLYEPDDGTMRVDDGPTQVELAPKTGTIQVSTRFGGAAEGVPVTVRGKTKLAGEQDLRLEGAFDETGQVRFDGRRLSAYEGLPIGRYEIGADISGSDFEVRSDDVDVTSEQESAAPEIRFTYELRQRHRRRIQDLRARLRDLEADPQKDTAIPAYFGSLISDVLDLIEAIPSEGRPFLENDASPDAVAAALLTASETAYEHIEYAMSDAQCVDLFAACSDMPPATVEWTGDLTLESFFDLLEQSPTDRRKTLVERRESVKNRMTRELDALSEIAPAERMVSEVSELVRDARNADSMENAAITFVSLAMLESTDELFDHPQLRKRMSRTVF